MLKKLIATTASIFTLSVAILPLSPAYAIYGTSRALVLNDACMTYFPNGKPFRPIPRDKYIYQETVRLRDGRLAVVLSVYPRPYTRIHVAIPISCVQHVRGRVIEY